jgi:transcription initiation factor TFIIIB Brf1 subunit/transcription initiation factor TFIIB
MHVWADLLATGEAVKVESKPLQTVRFVNACISCRPTDSPAATRKIQQICQHFRLSDVVSLAATRLYTLALEHKFTRGRRSMHVVAVCVYVACRQKETRNYMLIDFSDLLQVSLPSHMFQRPL